MDAVLYIIAGPLFMISTAGHFYVKIRLNPKDDSDVDDYYYEFEEQHPEYAKYLKWSRITFIGMAISVLLLFIAMVLK
ncbi:MAG: hypothetical protein JW837_02710 [Sedimentisphaerales bacterium]|nr:hypothetical protein [Sedimentisphaerales bacterium]